MQKWSLIWSQACQTTLHSWSLSEYPANSIRSSNQYASHGTASSRTRLCTPFANSLVSEELIFMARTPMSRRGVNLYSVTHKTWLRLPFRRPTCRCSQTPLAARPWFSTTGQVQIYFVCSISSIPVKRGLFSRKCGKYYQITILTRSRGPACQPRNALERGSSIQVHPSG